MFKSGRLETTLSNQQQNFFYMSKICSVWQIIWARIVRFTGLSFVSKGLFDWMKQYSGHDLSCDCKSGLTSTSYNSKNLPKFWFSSMNNDVNNCHIYINKSATGTFYWKKMYFSDNTSILTWKFEHFYISVVVFLHK